MELYEYSIDLRDCFSQDDIPNIRIILGNDMFFSSNNKEDKSLVYRFFKEVCLFSLAFLFF